VSIVHARTQLPSPRLRTFIDRGQRRLPAVDAASGRGLARSTVMMGDARDRTTTA